MQKLSNPKNKSNTIIELQKNIVRKRVEFYNSNPNALIHDNEAWKIINS